jgi:hypothetical protein
MFWKENMKCSEKNRKALEFSGRRIWIFWKKQAGSIRFWKACMFC